ncbi:protein ENHANCED DISEASE RESISTANCE 4 [Oryza sativa Japonica Group]|uniref:Extra-large G-protein-like n=3 Tax=Oryza TaxID=4527 RepID=Q0DBV2_ORYSJ|nr:uncharacterized protein LOC4341179 [Oryza sativa Japonica Group]KAB8102682.1 hypothetical protein EE612_034566 [Oryza sativa]BAD45677.1 extra-large G-protein-like [Oryza sativa Japonica Group]BAD45831.1 extra-large G-protein-like [Oryza sativa Japonica Group]BAF19671.1 Os06g0524300 [Oryza sativa Japonica Group]BAS98024.1 Os06g0524300 [Oryza sativa Japonica Group]|eukprot:NP_001057757.1 Os06g0524300 [Oryza sativa Japonica Group]
MEGDEGAAAAARIRLVRCPKCDKFLPELPAYSVYVCGGCGAALQAKKKYSAQGSDNSDNGHVKYLEVLESVAEAPEAMDGATADGRSIPNRISALHSRSVYNHEDNRMARGPSTSTGEATIRNDGREAKYMRIRNVENADMMKSVRGRGISDISPRSPIDGIPPTSYQAESLVNYQLQSKYRFSNREHANDRDLDGPSRVRGLEKDRAELLKMLDELRDQVQQSCEVTDAPSRSATTNRPADASSSHGAHDQPNQLRHDPSVLHWNGSHHSPSLNVQSPNIPQVHAPLPTRQNLHGYAEPIPHARASSYHAGAGYPCRNVDNFFFGHHDPDPLLSCHHEGLYHQPVCSCFNCYHREFLPVQGTPLGFTDQRAPYLMNSYGAYPVEGPLYGQQRYTSRGTNTSLQRNHLRTNVRKKPAQTCEPIAGGAPFTICYNCYEVLRIPMKHSLLGKEYKLMCGSCSHAILVNLDGSRLNVSEPAPGINLSAALQNGIGDSMRNNGHANADERLLPQYCFSNGSHESQEKDLESNSSESDSKHTPLGTDSENTPQSRDLPSEANVISHVPSLPHHDRCGFSPSEDSGKGSRSTHSEHEKAILFTESCKRNSIKDVCVANETQSPVDEFDDTLYAQDMLNLPQNVGHTRSTKAGDSFLTNLIKRSFKMNNGTRNGRARIFVNGFPISDRAVRKAEKLAGEICPGDYWYDYRAGFWGVMGRPCLGMIPPYIPEFNYPMPKNCGGGNTGIFINGRELHQKDLDLLVSRGLSDSPGRSYIVENSGKVSDEVSGEELYGLGKLAPTVEKMRRGFGMRVPRIIQ